MTSEKDTGRAPEVKATAQAEDQKTEARASDQRASLAPKGAPSKLSTERMPTSDGCPCCAGAFPKDFDASDVSGVIGLAGNPNVGKSTVFNALTGMHQHTGNWPGKTVGSAWGKFEHKGAEYALVDTPGSYSLMARSAEEEVTRDFVCFGRADAVAVVCDATCLERNLHLALQVMETGKPVVLCVNLMDEARSRHIEVDLELLSKRLGVPVIATTARDGVGLDAFMDACAEAVKKPRAPFDVSYSPNVEEALEALTPVVAAVTPADLEPRWVAARLLDADAGMLAALADHLGRDIAKDPAVAAALDAARAQLADKGLATSHIADVMAASVNLEARRLCKDSVKTPAAASDARDRRLDRIFTRKLTGFPIMLLILLAVFWITITGANVPSDLLADVLFSLEDKLAALFQSLGAPDIVTNLVVHGGYNVMAWVISVMLPPMAIFFPLFTLLEDFGYLPRVAFNLDKFFKHAQACGKQALTMCMGFGCNAAGVTGCRIIDSPRERLLAVLTNNFVPCNGRFPTMISVITMFLVGGAGGVLASLAGAGILVAVIVFGIAMTLWVSRVLSRTVLKGVPSSFTLEMPPYRRPQVGKVIVRSIIDRTLRVLFRAVVVAAPAGLLIWVLANVSVGGTTLLAHVTSFLDPVGRLMGLDGTILAGFIIGLPANEIVMPVIIMAYLAQGGLVELDGPQLLNLLVSNGWTWVTAICVVLFELMHWPCATTLLTIHSETKSWKWTGAALLIPTVCGFVTCVVAHALLSLVF